MYLFTEKLVLKLSNYVLSDICFRFYNLSKGYQILINRRIALLSIDERLQL